MAGNQVGVQFWQVDEFPPEPAIPFSWYVKRIDDHYELRVTDGNGNYKLDNRSETAVKSLLQLYSINYLQRRMGMVVLITAGPQAGKRYKLINNPATNGTSPDDWQSHSTVEEVNLGTTQQLIDFLQSNLQNINN